VQYSLCMLLNEYEHPCNRSPTWYDFILYKLHYILYKNTKNWLIFGIFVGRRIVGGSLIGGIAETQEMLDFCGKHNITCMTQKIPISYVNTAMERLIKNDVKYRFVIDIGNTLTNENDIGNTITEKNDIGNTPTDEKGSA
jgi:hypothetical protein